MNNSNETSKYAYKIKIRKCHEISPKSTEKLVIDLKEGIVEVQKTKAGTELFNHRCFTISDEAITNVIVFFNMELLNNELNKKKDIINTELYCKIKYYDENKNKYEFIYNPKDKSSPIYSIIKWVKKDYEDFQELQDFTRNLD